MDTLVIVIIVAVVVVALGYWLVARRQRPSEAGTEDEREPRPPDEVAREPKAGPREERGERAKAAPRDKEPAEPAPKAPVAEAREAEPASPEATSGAAVEPRAAAGTPTPSPARAAAAPEPEDASALEARKERRAAFRKGLQSTRGGFIAKLGSLLKGKRQVDADLLDAIEEVMLTSDVGVQFTDRLKKSLEQGLSQKQLEDEDAVWSYMKDLARDILAPEAPALDIASAHPFVMMVVGVNGVGKTTTIAKLASRYVRDGKKVVLAAGDTFRAAAVRQLEMWGERVGAEVVKEDKQGADPASVTFKAIERAREVGAHVVIADTAGRLHTKTPLMDELKKVRRVMGKALEGAPHEILLVLDANTGQNANQQAREFKEALGVTGLVLTKLDGTAKGGVILGICEEHGLPVRYVGVGERDDDLREFDPNDFVDVLFEHPSDANESAA